MSLAINELQTVNVFDPRIAVENTRRWALVKGGSEVTSRQYTTTNFNNSAMTFSCPPPSLDVFVDRDVRLRTGVTIDFVGTSGAELTLLNGGYDAFRKNPLSKIINNMQVTLNTSTISIQIGDVIPGLERAHAYPKETEYAYGMTPSYPDASQDYNDLTGTNRNPLGSYAEQEFGSTPRGAFPFNVVSNTETTAQVTAVLTEPIFMSPFLWTHEGPGLFNIQTMDFQFNFNPNLSSIWSHANGISNITSMTVTFNNPVLLFTYITPKPTMAIPRANLVYPFYNVTRYPTGPTTIASLASSSVVTSTINISTIPKRIYLFAMRQPGDRNSTTTDTFAAIDNISLQFGNASNLLATATPQQLYNMSKKNGLAMSWTEWSGGQVFADSNDFSSKIGTVGSVVIIEPGKDFGLSDTQVAGLNEKLTMQFNVQLRNVSNASITYTIYVVTVDDGLLTIPTPGQSFLQIGVVSVQDIINSVNSPSVLYSDIDHLEGGDGDFRGGKIREKIAAFFRNVLLPKAKQYGNEVFDHGINLGKQKLYEILDGRGGARVGGSLVGGNDGYSHGHSMHVPNAGALVGGRHISRSHLRQRRH